MTDGDIARTTIRDEGGFTMAVVMIVGFVTAMIVGVSLTAANGDLNLTRNDLDQKQAFEAAQAGIADYQYHLNSDTNFWTNCATVPTPTAVNLQGSTARRLAVPGTTGSSYAIELLRASTSPGSANCSTADPAGTMLEGAASTAPGTFRIRSTGYAGDSKQSIVATWKRRSFLDYIYFTQLETSDPVTYGDPATVAGAYTQCTKKIGPIWSQGRYGAPIPGSGGDYCVVIQFAPAGRRPGAVPHQRRDRHLPGPHLRAHGGRPDRDLDSGQRQSAARPRRISTRFRIRPGSARVATTTAPTSSAPWSPRRPISSRRRRTRSWRRSRPAPISSAARPRSS